MDQIMYYFTQIQLWCRLNCFWKREQDKVHY